MEGVAKIDENKNFDPLTLVFEEACILIADDNKEDRNLLKDYLGHSPIKILEAENGKEAVDLAISKKPNLILMDMRMPIINGTEATRLIKENPETNHIPVIAISASSSIVFKVNNSSEMFCDFLMKPVVLSQLAEAFKKHLKFTEQIPNDKKEKLKDLSNQLTGEQLEKLPELLNIINTEIYPIYLEVNKKQVVDQIEKFGQKLITLGSQYSFDLLSNFGKDICTYSDNFEIDKLMKKMKSFPDIVARYQKLINNNE